MATDRVRVGINGGGVLGWSVAAAVRRQPDMELLGIHDGSVDSEVSRAVSRGFGLYALLRSRLGVESPGYPVHARFEDLLETVEVVVDCSAKGLAPRSLRRCASTDVKVVQQSWQPGARAVPPFLAEINYTSTVGQSIARVVSSDTAGVVRILDALRLAGLVGHASATLARRLDRRTCAPRLGGSSRGSRSCA